MCLAVPGRILFVEDDGDALFRRARVDFGGIVREVNLSCVPQANHGDYVLVHVGFAISRIDKSEAERILRELDTLEEDELPGDVPPAGETA